MITVVVGGTSDTDPPGSVHADDLSGARDLVASASEPLAWLVASGTRVDTGTLAALEAHAPAPAASLVVDSEGTPVDALLGRFGDDESQLVETARERCVPLRHVDVVSLLLPRDLVAEVAGPDPRRFGAYAGSEWTARMFARRPGVLVCASVATVDRPARPPLQDTLRMARSGTWRRGEIPGEVYRALAGR